MKKTLQLVSLICFLLATQAMAQDPSGKDIAALAQKTGLDVANAVSASGDGIRGKFIPAKSSPEQKDGKRIGSFIGLLDLQVSDPDYDQVRSGKYNLFLKEAGGPKLYLESSGRISAILEVSESTPEGYQGQSTGKRFDLAFPLPSSALKRALGPEDPSYKPQFAPVRVSFFRRCKLYVKITYKGRDYWVWSGVTANARRCGDLDR